MHPVTSSVPLFLPVTNFGEWALLCPLCPTEWNTEGLSWVPTVHQRERQPLRVVTPIQRALGCDCLSHSLIGSLPCLDIWELWTTGVKTLMFICPFLLDRFSMIAVSRHESHVRDALGSPILCIHSILHVPSNTCGQWDARSGLRSMEEPDLPEEAITPTGWHFGVSLKVRF